MNTVASASERLAASRERLRLDMQAALHPSSNARPEGGAAHQAQLGSAGSRHGMASAWQAIPGATVLGEALGAWWQQHPAHKASTAAADAAKVALVPVAQKHPWALVGGALVLGALFAWSKPWRWAMKPALKSALFAGLLPQLWSKTLPYLSSLPLQAWLTALGAAAGTPTGRTNTPSRQNPPGA
jgi:hypothetical protein